MITPWTNRPLKRKIYGPRRVTLPASPGGGVPSITTIHFPAWTYAITIWPSTSSAGSLAWAPVPAANFAGAPFNADGGYWINVISAMTQDRGNAFETRDRVEVMTNQISMWNYTASPHVMNICAWLTDIPATAMPDIDTDLGTWATYNSDKNNPT